MSLAGTQRDLAALVEPVTAIAARAGEVICEVYESDFAVQAKDDKSPLTAADTVSHKLICRELAALTPEWPVLSEESAAIPYAVRQAWRCYWLVDPLDGTREFVKRNGEFTVNIALIEGHSPILGVLGVPVQKSVYFATRGQGAFKQERGGSPQRIHCRRTDRERFIGVGSRSHGSGKQKIFLDSLGPAAEVLNIGSALKFCLVAEGRADIYARFGPTSEWDTAAAQCLVEEAGGMVVDFDWEPLRYNTKESLLNPHFIVVADRGFDWKPYFDQVER